MTDAKKHILIVEDEQADAESMASALRENGYATTVAAGKEEASARLREAPPDLIALDIQLPEKASLELYREIKKDKVFRAIPLVAVSGVKRNDMDMDDFVKTFVEAEEIAPPEAYVEKPVDGRVLKETVAGAFTVPQPAPDRRHKR